ncbi:scoloptoxin SSD14-like isoform X2 [Chrysoperla carnea]|uniref:scoloptoxin SSD14-like isoform X2 n=1 Tax=Chrysoperla carnea TaxID=189513 RepID=UPI001D095763|nr:scoloptoxin SSD14-like isoform X2 [Chrysoperla carnea]
MAIKKVTISGPRNSTKVCQLPRLTKTHVTVISILLILCACFVGYIVWSGLAQKQFGGLKPPNPEQELPASASKLQEFRRAAVCADSILCARIGRDILAKNGSAMDATLAALFCNGVVNMQSMGLGGGFFMTVYINETREAVVLNAREKAPLNSSLNMFNGDSQKSKVGPLAVAVPGELRGYWAAYKRFGKLPWKDIIEPTIKICESGYNMTAHQHFSLSKSPSVRNDPVLRELFIDKETNKFKPAGSLIKPKKICNTLRIIAENGGDDLNNGTLSKILSEDIKEMGGIITEEDLNTYEPVWTEPIKVTLRDDDVLYTVPPPASGVLLGLILNVLNQYNFTEESIADIDDRVLTYHRIIEAFKYAFAKRTELGDLNFLKDGKAMVKNLTSQAYAQQIYHQINDSRTYQDPEHYGAKAYTKNNHGTAHISVLAPNGDAVSVTSTINIYFGPSITSQRTGIILNSGMDDFSSPGYENYFGLPFSPANAIAPGKRPLSSMTPSIITDKDGNVKVVVGAAGGTRITTSVAYVLMQILWFGKNVKQAVDAPRIHHQLYPMDVKYEYGVLRQVIEGLEHLGHKMDNARLAASVVCAIVKEAGKILANADYRKGGEVFGLD